MALSNKIDFMCIIIADHCNPNGDPLYLNRPRQSFDGYGEITSECIKRKIRNRLQDMGESIFVQMSERCTDGCKSLRDRAKVLGQCGDPEKYASDACKMWYDVRAFGQVFAYKGENKNDGVSVSVRGPVSITFAKSIEPIWIAQIGGVKTVNNETTESVKRDSSTFFTKYIIDHGVYTFTGSISPQLAERTGFSDEDAEKTKQALLTLFENDESACRPRGSMAVGHLFWWRHQGKQSICQPQKLLQSVKITPTDRYPFYIVDFDNIYNAEIYNML